MERPQISNRKSLDLRLADLKANRVELENLLTARAVKLYANLSNPAPYIKKTVAELASDKTFRADLLSLALNAITRYLMNRQREGSKTKTSGLLNLLNKFAGTGDNSGTGDITSVLKDLYQKFKVVRNS